MRVASFLYFLLVVLCHAICADDFSLLGGDLTSNVPGPAALQAPAPNLSAGELKDKQVDGFDPFHTNFNLSEGLGPFFVNRSCGGCHIENGKGRVRMSSVVRQENQMVVKVSQRRQVDENGGPVDVPGVGGQLQD